MCLHRSFEDIEEAAKPGGICAQGGRHPLSVSQAFSLRHRADLLEDLTAADVQEMREVVLSVLGNIAGEELLRLIQHMPSWACPSVR